MLDDFAEAAAYGPGRIVPDFGYEFTGLEVAGSGAYPVRVIVRHTGEERTVLAKYVVGCATCAAQSAPPWASRWRASRAM